MIEPTIDARFVRLNISRPTYGGEDVARIYEFEIYGPDEKRESRARPSRDGKPALQSRPVPEKAVNGSVAGGKADSWCAEDRPLFLQVDLGAARPVKRFVVKHASAGGENAESDTRDFNIQVSADGKTFTTPPRLLAPASSMNGPISRRSSTSTAGGTPGSILRTAGGFPGYGSSAELQRGSTVFARIFQFFYLRLAVFFGCLGMFMYLFSGEISNRTLHYWFLAPARREVLLAGKYAAGLIASS